MLLKFVCISIFCIFCLFGRTQLPAVAAVPFEYNEDHEQYPYDLETEQSKAKYDTRLLSQQLQEAEQKSSEESNDDIADHSHDEENEEEKAGHVHDNDELQPHERAASCYTHEHKYTHGQKVPRLDPCEICLCMDGEIFCWWEKCEKRKPQNVGNNKNAKYTKKSHRSKKMLTKTKTTPKPLSSQFREYSSTSELVEFQPHINELSNKLENQYNTKSSLKKQHYQQNTQRQFEQEHKVLQQQQELEHHKHQEQHQEQQQQLKLQKSHQHDKHSSAPTRLVSNSKIMNFPENLPSVLYYDYHTEEHEHHQHQHHQQHLKHQLQKKLQKLHNRQQQHQQHQHQQDRQQKAKQLITDSISLLTTSAVTPPIQAHRNNNGFNRNSVSSPSIFAYNDNDDSQTDSDILPEPPTKKPKILLAAISSPAKASTKLTISESNATLSERQQFDLDDNAAEHIIEKEKEWSSNTAGNGGEVRRLFVGETSATSSIFATDDVIEINKNINENPRKTFSHQTFNTMNVDDNNGKNDEEEQDDAFHRWLTSTETYNNKKSNNNNDKSNYGKKNNNDSYSDENLPYGNENSYATESSEFENPFGIQNLTMNSQQNIHNNKNKNSNNKNNKNNSKNKNKNNNNNKSNKLFYPKDQERAQNAENGFLHGAFNNDYSDYNGSVVNIDILLTTQDEMRQQQQQQLHSNFEKQAETEQLPKTPASIMFAAGLILNRSDINQTAKTINDTKMSAGESTPESSTKPNPIQSQTKMTTMALTAPTASKATTTTITQTPTSYVQFVRHNGTETEEELGTGTGTTPGTTTISERQCNVMGSLYKIGEVLPQDTGNCLQCICIDGSTNDETPRVTCSPHNCPPLVLPDLFDATGY